MCGLCGILTNSMNAEKENIFKDLLAASTLRGWHGAGVAAVPTKHKGQKIELFYTEGTAAELAYRSEFTEWLNRRNSVCLMGHARFPTSGGEGVEDCHPIHHLHIVGAHNGTLSSVNGQKVKVNEHDSKLLFQTLNLHGPEKTFKEVEGSYAVTYLNKNTERLYLMRNRERSLFMAMVEGDPGTMFWASEAAMLKTVIQRRCTSTVQLFQLKPGLLVGYRLFFQGAIDFEQVQLIEPKTSVPLAGKLDDRPISSQVFKTLGNTYLDMPEMERVLKAGCANCQQVADMTDYVQGQIHFFKPKEFMCSVCLDYDPNAQTQFKTHGVELPKGTRPIPQ